MDSFNVVVVYPVGQECLRQIAAVSPKLKVHDASKLWSCVGKDITEPKGDGLQDKRDSLLAQADIVYGYTPPENIATRAPKLKWIQTMLAGVNHFLKPELVQSPVTLTTASGIQSTPVSELALQMMLMLAKRAPFCFQNKQAKKWQRFVTPMLRSQTLGIMGLGRIGKEVARLAKCFGMRVVALDMKAVKSRHADLLLTMKQLPRLLSESDFLVLTLPLTPETRNLIGEKELRAMKPTAYLVNVARGEIIDEQALVKALKEHWIAGAGLDVFAVEPLPVESPLWESPDVIISPHIAGTMVDYDKLATNLFCENLERYVNGKRLLNIVNKKRGF